MRNQARRLLKLSSLLLCLAFATGASALKHMATMQLPCESGTQMISPTGEQVALRCSDHTLRLVNIASGAMQHTFTAEQHVNSYNYSRDGRWFAVGLRDGTVEVVSTSGAPKIKQWKADTRRIEVVEFFPDSSAIIVGPLDRPGQVWDLAGAPKLRATLHSDFGGLGACAFSPDGKLLATADGDTVIRFYDTATWQMLHDYRGLKLETFTVAFTTDGKRLLIGGPDDHIVALDPATGAEARRFTKESDVIQQILPFGTAARALVLYVDGDAHRPPHQAIWNVDTGKSVPLKPQRPLSGGGIVHNQLWVSSSHGKTLDIWAYE